MFYDLNVRRPQKPAELIELLKRLVKLGYNAVAITTDLTEEYFKTTESGKKNKNKPANAVPPPVDVAKYSAEVENIKIFNRVNITLNDPAVVHRITQCKLIKSYDLISYLPGNSSVLKMLTGVQDIDILCFNPAIDNPPLFFNRKLYGQFVQNGVYFELPYAPAIVDSTHRKYCFYTASVYHAVGKSQNIVVTSAGWDKTHFRSPYDVMNFSFLYGLTEEQAKNAITKYCTNLLHRAKTRRRGRATIEMVFQSVNQEKDDIDEQESLYKTIDLTLGTTM